MVDISNLSFEEQQMILARRAYAKEWRAKNPDKVRKHVENFLKKQVSKLSGTDTATSKPDTAN